MGQRGVRSTEGFEEHPSGEELCRTGLAAQEHLGADVRGRGE